MGKPRLQYGLEFYIIMILFVIGVFYAVGISAVYWTKLIIPTRVNKLAAPEPKNTIGLLPVGELVANAVGKWIPTEDVERVSEKSRRGVQVYNRGGISNLRVHQICIVEKGDRLTVIGVSPGKGRVLVYLLEFGSTTRSELSCPEKTMFPVSIEWLGDNHFLEKVWKK